MKIDKEYPATHSMSTAWYVADEEGNVGIIDYNENGPVPWETEESCIGALVFGHEEGINSTTFLPIHLTKEQFFELIEKPRSPYDEKEWCCDTIVQIDLAQEKEFLKLTKNDDAKLIKCLSKSLGFYEIACYNSFIGKSDYTYRKPLKNSSLRKMLDSNMLLKLYSLKDFYISDKWVDNTVVYEYNFKSAPYYIYAQPYCSDFLTVRINIPKESVKLSQLPEILQRRVPRVPFKFKDCERFQIAEYTPCMSYYNDDTIVNLDGCQYSLLPTTEGGKAYFMESMHDIDFYPYCSEKDKYGCEKCSNYCATCNEHVFTDHPTVMIVVSPYSKFKYDYQFTSIVR